MRPKTSLLVLCGATLMVVLDTTITTVALPTVRAALDFGPATLEWVVTAYAAAFGGLLLAGGRLGDRHGRRRVFFAGIALFTAGSAGCGLADVPAALVVARAVQGAGAALAAPAALALLVATHPDPVGRGRAMGVYASMSGLGSVLGLVLGGVLTTLVSWRAVFLVNLPVGLLLLAAIPRTLPFSPGDNRPLDLQGAVCAAAVVGLATTGLVHAAGAGWAPAGTWAPLLCAGVALGSLLARERPEAPLIPAGLLRPRGRPLAGLACFGLALYGGTFFLVQDLQGRLELGPVRTGLAFLPLAVPLAVAAAVAGRLAPVAGARRLAACGCLAAAVGLGCTALVVDAGGGYATLVAPLLLAGGGLGLMVVSLTLATLQGVEPARSGVASALASAAQQVGGSVGLAVLGTTALAGPGDGPVVARAVAVGAGIVALGVLVCAPTGPSGVRTGAPGPA